MKHARTACVVQQVSKNAFLGKAVMRMSLSRAMRDFICAINKWENEWPLINLRSYLFARIVLRSLVSLMNIFLTRHLRRFYRYAKMINKLNFIHVNYRVATMRRRFIDKLAPLPRLGRVVSLQKAKKTRQPSLQHAPPRDKDLIRPD